MNKTKNLILMLTCLAFTYFVLMACLKYLGMLTDETPYWFKCVIGSLYGLMFGFSFPKIHKER